MKFPFVNDPKTGQPDEMVTVVLLTTLAVVGRFLLDGISINIMGHKVEFGHVDAMSYAALLAPVLGAHGFMSSKASGDKK